MIVADSNVLVDRSADPSVFFELLPSDWHDFLMQYWPDYSATTKVLTIESGNEVLGGGLVFSKMTPDTAYYEGRAQYWFGRGHLYLAYIWIIEPLRGKGLGERWIRMLHEAAPDQEYWLAIENERLRRFYERCGYHVAEQIDSRFGREWIMVSRLPDEARRA